MNHYRVELDTNGKPRSCELLSVVPKTTDGSVLIVEARNEDHAKQVAYNTYCAKKKKAAKLRNQAAGRCECGRPNDRKDECDPRTGVPLKRCSVCSVRQKAYNRTMSNKKLSPVPSVPYARDEPARIETNLERQRDRKNEMRIEVLVEVQKAWQNAQSNGKFTQWLASEISKCTKPVLRVVGS